ncbi:MAG: hypothetical protein AB7U20_12040 [Planctomycetaceae bacterium]
MSLIAMQMPETHAELVDWLEQHLVGLELAALVAELSAVHGSGDRPENYADATSAVNLLSGRIPAVIENGLSVLDTAQVRALLRHPHCLLELQELVLTSGGAHWEKRMDDSTTGEFQRIAETGWRRMQLAIAPPMGSGAENGRVAVAAADTVSGDSPTEVTIPTVRLSEAREQRAAAARARSAWPSVLGTAAVFLLGALGLQQAGLLTLELPQTAPLANAPPPGVPENVPVAKGWGWERPGAIPNEGPAEIYLTTLAHSADEWFNKRPKAGDDVAKRIQDFSHGCQMLIEAPHTPLTPEDREWLVERCKAWQSKLDSHLAALNAGEDPIAVRDAADATVEQLIKAMRKRADELA